MSDEVIAELRREIEALRARVLQLEGAPRPTEPPAPDARVSRRAMLGKAGAVAAAGVAGAVVGGGVAAQPAAADTGDYLLLGYQSSNVAFNPTAIALQNNEDSFVFGAYDYSGTLPNAGYIAAYARKRASGRNIPAFRGDAEASSAFVGTSKTAPAVFGTSTGSAGVQGNCTGSGVAGVVGASASSDGVFGLSTNGTGVHGSGGTVGGSFQGKSAAVRLMPQPSAGKPTSGLHARGELLCDKNGVLWFCTAGGNPGTWKKVTLS
jgi:hypothetical protein